ncbi:MAG: DegT/DnrJ/EryC1/StrS aminotransferase family protein [Ardenticatenaceae bacterium]|nr:DegT/DnrJ/EryC1/StrS aminotransferase family protein [Ardenticatenaceae bacterium]MCB9443930.1 DegT/DnrJ/EryC1/StrS aminotransferase family protein [Ardenticatenaceae bacterium]
MIIERVPVRTVFLPFNRPDITETEVDEVVDTLYSGWLTTGPKTKAFESQFADFVGSRHALAVNSCTAALHTVLAAAGIGPGDEVIVPTMTFAATANVIIHQRATPVFVDVQPDTLNIDPTAVARAITPRTRAIIPVHLYGHPCDMAALQVLAQTYELLIIEDAAHAVGAYWHNKPIGSIGHATAFSFYATKNLVTAEGGMITTNNSELDFAMRRWVLHGISRDAWDRYTQQGSWYYEIILPGFKYNMTDIQAALGLHQLARLERMQSRRQQIANRYQAGFTGLTAVELPTCRSDVVHAWHLYPIRLRLEQLTIDRAAFIEALRGEGIGSSVHFIPLHRHPYYREQFDLHPAMFPVADEAYERLISLPLYTRMSDADVDDVIEAVRCLVQRYGR